VAGRWASCESRGMRPRTAARASTAALTGVLAAGVLAPDALRAAGPGLLVAAAVAGVPHGAADLALLRAGTAPGRPRALALAGYAGAAALAVAIALAVPAWSLAALLLLSVVHFAEGETGFARLAGAARGAGWSGAAVGTAVVAVPLARWPDDVRPVLAALSPELAAVLGTGAARVALAATVGAVAAVALSRADRTSRREVLLVLTAALAVPPLAFFAVWFAGWHALRHLARLGAAQPLRPVLQEAALPSAVAIVALAALAPLVGAVPASALLVLLALTVPHAVVVATAGQPGADERRAVNA